MWRRMIYTFVAFFPCLGNTVSKLFWSVLSLIDALLPLVNNVNVSDRAGRSSLHHAAYNGHAEVSWSFMLSLIFMKNS